MKVVIDTNVTVSGILTPTGTPGKLLEQLVSAGFYIVISDLLLEEYRRVLARPHLRTEHKLNDREINSLIETFRVLRIHVEPDTTLRIVVADPKDDIFVQTALAGEADYIVSGDKHLLGLREHRGIPVVTPVAFLAILEAHL